MRRSRWLLPGIILIVISLIPFLTVEAFGPSFSYREPSAVPLQPVAVVFGALVYPGSRLSPFLSERVDGAVRLYKAGRVRQLLMTGDNGRIGYDEPGAMRDAAVAAGVPATDIIVDDAGFDTYQSCFRLRSKFGITQAVLVSQNYHMPRALYVCRALGVDSVGYGVDSWGTYPGRTFVYIVREAGSDLKAFWQLYVVHSKPSFTN